MNELENFISMSKYAGERFDIVQAGGGNSSVKFDDGTMLIKASGFSLSEISEDKGYVKLDNAKLNSILTSTELLSIQDKRIKEKKSSDLISECIIESNGKPSIETFLHSLLGKYTLHTHPVVVNIITLQLNWKVILKKIFPDAMYVNYNTPGIELAIELSNELSLFKNEFNMTPKIIFLQNHGIIISSDSLSEVVELNESTLLTLEKFLHLDYSASKSVTQISSLYNSIYRNNSISYLVRSEFLNFAMKLKKSIFFLDSFCPDGQVFCGRKSLELDNLKDESSFLEFEKKYSHPARVIIFKDRLYCIAPNVKKAKEMEDVLEFHISALFFSDANRNYLEEEEVIYLENWDAEKYRKKL